MDCRTKLPMTEKLGVLPSGSSDQKHYSSCWAGLRLSGSGGEGVEPDLRFPPQLFVVQYRTGDPIAAGDRYSLFGCGMIRNALVAPGAISCSSLPLIPMRRILCSSCGHGFASATHGCAQVA